MFSVFIECLLSPDNLNNEVVNYENIIILYLDVGKPFKPFIILMKISFPHKNINWTLFEMVFVLMVPASI